MARGVHFRPSDMAARLGIELLEGMNPIASFVVPEETASAPFCLGRRGQVILPFEGVLDAHAVFVFAEGRLWAASACRERPVLVGARALPTEWVEIALPCLMRMGRIAVRAYVVRDAPAPRVEHAGPTVIVRAKRREQAARPLADQLFEKLVHDWQGASTAVKLLCATLPIAAFLFACAR